MGIAAFRCAPAIPCSAKVSGPTTSLSSNPASLRRSSTGRSSLDSVPETHFGEACLLGGMRRIATVRACEPSVLWELDGKAFGDALHGDAAMREIAYGVARTRLMHAGASESLMV